MTEGNRVHIRDNKGHVKNERQHNPWTGEPQRASAHRIKQELMLGKQLSSAAPDSYTTKPFSINNEEERFSTDTERGRSRGVEIREGEEGITG